MIKIINVQLTPNVATVGQSVKVEVEITENTWAYVKSSFADWNEIKTTKQDWNAIKTI